MSDLLTRARNTSGMLRMCEKISFGADADMIDELAEEVERLNADLDESLRRYDDRNRTAIERAGRSGMYMARLAKLQAEIDRLRLEYQSNSMLDHGRRQMLDHFEAILKGGPNG